MAAKAYQDLPGLTGIDRLVTAVENSASDRGLGEGGDRERSQARAGMTRLVVSISYASRVDFRPGCGTNAVLSVIIRN